MKNVFFVTDDIDSPVNLGLRREFEKVGYQVAHASVAEVQNQAFQFSDPDDLKYAIIDFDSEALKVSDGPLSREVSRLKNIFPENARLIAINGTRIKISEFLRKYYQNGEIQYLATDSPPENVVGLLELVHGKD